jgi:hypothetical protein
MALGDPSTTMPAWAPPESDLAAPEPADPTGPVRTGTPSREEEWSDRPPPPEPPPLPVRLAPMTLSDLLDGAWAIIACRPRTVLGLSALIIVPAEIVASFLVRGYGQALDLGTVFTIFFPFSRTDDAGRALGYSATAVLALFVLSFAYMVLGAAIGRLVSAWYDDADLTLRQVLGATLRAMPALVVAWIVTTIVQVLSIVSLGLPALFTIPLFLLVAPVITIEGRGPLKAINRSCQLVSRRLLAVIGIWLVSLFLERLLDSALALAPDFAANFVPGPVAQVLRPAGWAFALFVTAPTVAGLAVLLYYDLRVRTEGLDLEIDAAEAFGTGAADAR